ncbi:MAG TPA: hypothetical protein VHE30_22970, partial [Polyangiaceae bacterium]|nr:hypothetical protein [Polyangiaceae bacterium]
MRIRARVRGGREVGLFCLAVGLGACSSNTDGGGNQPENPGYGGFPGSGSGGAFPGGGTQNQGGTGNVAGPGAGGSLPGGGDGAGGS